MNLNGRTIADHAAMIPHPFNDISFLVIQSAIEVHRTLGPGLLESVYRACMIYELRQRNLAVAAEQIVTINYKGVIVEGAYRLDLLVGDSVVVEIKAVEVTLPVHHAQVLSYLRLTNKPIGLLINFNVPVLVKGIKRIMNGSNAAALSTRTPVPPS